MFAMVHVKRQALVLLLLGVLSALTSGHGIANEPSEPCAGQQVVQELHEVNEVLREMRDAMKPSSSHGEECAAVTIKLLALEARLGRAESRQTETETAFDEWKTKKDTPINTKTKEALDDLKAKLDEAQINLGDVAAKLQASEAKQAAAEAKLRDLNAKLQASETNQKTAESNMEKVEVKLQSYEAVQNVMETALKGYETKQTSTDAKQSACEASQKAANTKFIEVQAKLESLNTTQRAAETKLKATESKLINVETTLTTVESKLATMETEQKATDTSLEGLTREQKTLESALDAAEATLEALETRVEDDETKDKLTDQKLQGIETTLTAVQASLTDCQSKQTSTQTQLVTVEGALQQTESQLERLGSLQNATSSELRATRLHFVSRSGSTFVRWGRKTCSNNTQLVYNGVAGGSHYTHPGGGANLLCLTLSPQTDATQAPSTVSYVFGAEYEGIGNHHNQDVPCSVCRTQLSTTIMVPATHACPSGWTRQYAGHLVSGDDTHAGPSEFNCLDIDPEDMPRGHRNANGRLLFYTVSACGSLPCPPYAANKIMLCVVCSK